MLTWLYQMKCDGGSFNGEHKNMKVIQWAFDNGYNLEHICEIAAEERNGNIVLVVQFKIFST